MKKNDYKTKSKKELSEILEQEKQEIAKLILERNANKLKNTAIVGQKRLNIARILTIIRQKETE